MTKVISFYKWIAFLLTFLLAFLIAFTAHAQTPSDPEDVAAKYGVTFPIAGLGGCGDLTSCRTYCEDLLNSSSCINFAKQKGFYQEDKFEVKDDTLAVVKSQLGCDSYASCLNFCEIPANHDKCDSFAKSQGLVGGHVDDPSKTQVISRAREVLGCDSQAGCQSLCSLEENRQKCSDFAKEVGLRGGEHQVGPGGCTSEATCKSFCSDPNNYSVCSGFASTSGGSFTGPGGCNSEATCKTYCQGHENECRASFQGPGGPGGSPPPGYNPQEMCNRTPNCSWTGNTCQCGFYGETDQSQHYEDYCTKNPDQCKPPTTGGTGGYGDPATECARYGCTWSNNSCQCYYPTPGTYISPSYGSPEPGYSYPSPYLTPVYGTPNQIQGVSTSPTLFDLIWRALTQQ